MKFNRQPLLLLFLAFCFLPSRAWCQSPAPPPMMLSAPIQQAQPAPSGFFYYCAQTRSYYPSVAQCEAGWIAIPASAPPPSSHPWNWTEQATPQEAVVSRPHVFSLELEGRALNYSFNYDQSISDNYSLGVGISNWQQGSWWDDYQASVTVLPIYLTYYFSKLPNRAYLTFGVDGIYVNQPGDSSRTFENTGAAVTAGGGFESRSNDGFLFRIGGVAIIGRSAIVAPSFSIGYSF